MGDGTGTVSTKYGKAEEVRDSALPYLDTDAQIELKNAIWALLYEAYAPGNGGWYFSCGPSTMGRLIKLSGFDMNKRKINKLQNE